MAEIASTIPAGDASGGAGAPPVAPVAVGSVPSQAGILAAPVGAKESVARSGGNPTGRKPQGKFKHPANTPAGKEERRKADSDRKKQDREEAARLAEPPPLPPPAQSVSDQAATPGTGLAVGDSPQTVETFIPWTDADVRGFTDELVELSEARRIDDFISVAKEASLPASLVKKIESDCRYPVATKAGLKTAIARTSAKWLNKSGISAKNKEEAALLFFGATIWLQGRRLRSHLETMIAEDRATRLQAEDRARRTAGRAGGPAETYTLPPGGSTPPPATTR